MQENNKVLTDAEALLGELGSYYNQDLQVTEIVTALIALCRSQAEKLADSQAHVKELVTLSSDWEKQAKDSQARDASLVAALEKILSFKADHCKFVMVENDKGEYVSTGKCAACPDEKGCPQGIATQALAQEPVSPENGGSDD